MKIETQDWSYSCGDGCCYDSGTTLFINGKEVDCRAFSNLAEAYEYILESVLGHDVCRRDGDYCE